MKKMTAEFVKNSLAFRGVSDREAEVISDVINYCGELSQEARDRKLPVNGEQLRAVPAPVRNRRIPRGAMGRAA